MSAALLTLAVGLAPPPTFTLNLSAPAETRWRGAVGLVLAAHPFNESFGPTFAEHNVTLFSKLTERQYHTMSSALKTHWPEQANELRGIASDFAAAGHFVSFEYLVAWVYFHALAHTPLLSADADTRECTGILARTASGGVLHVANMDQSPMSVRNITLHVKFVFGNGSLAFEGADWYWITTGVSRAVKGGVASLQENWRTTHPRPLDTVLTEIADGVGTPQMFVFRQALGALTTFDAVHAYVSSVRLFAPYYVVAAGAHGEGNVIARGISSVDGEAVLGDHTDPWFVVQTNYDHWKSDSKLDPRRTHAEGTMRALGSAMAGSTVGLYAAASSYPVHNPHTAFTALMDPSTGAFNALVRDAMCPVDGSALAGSDSRYCTAAAA